MHVYKLLNKLQLLSNFFISKKTKQKIVKQKYLNKYLSLIGIPQEISENIQKYRREFALTPAQIQHHLWNREKIKKNNLNAHTLTCTCLICKLTDQLRSLKKEQKRLELIKNNIQISTDFMHKIGEWTYKLKDNKKFIKWNELQEFGFSKAFIDNMPIVLQIENERDRGKIRHENFLFKEIPIRGLGSNNHTTFGSTFYLIQRNLVTMKKKTENLEIQIKKLKKLTYLP